MREGISVTVSAADRERLVAVVADRNSPQKHVSRARIILATAEGCGTAEIMRRAGVSKPCVWRWQERFMREGVAGLLREKTRKPGLPPLPPALVDRVVALTLSEPPGEATPWTGRATGAPLMAAKGQEEPFPPPRLNGGCRLRKRPLPEAIRVCWLLAAFCRLHLLV